VRLQKCKNIKMVDGKPVCMTKQGQAQPRACSDGSKDCYHRGDQEPSQRQLRKDK